MKKLISLVLILTMLLSLGAGAFAADRSESAELTYRDIRLLLDGREIVPCDESGNTAEPFIMGGNTYLPLRAVAQALGLSVKWVAETDTVELTTGGEVITGKGLRSGSEGKESTLITYRGIRVTLDGKELELKNALGESVEPFIMGGTTYLPLRVIGEALDLPVDWDGSSSTVLLGTLPENGVWKTSFHDASIVYGDENTVRTAIRTVYDEEGRVAEEYIEYDEGFEQRFYSYDSEDRVVRSTFIDRFSGFEDIITETVYGGDVFCREISTCYPAPEDGSLYDSYEDVAYRFHNTVDYDEEMNCIGFYYDYGDGTFDFMKQEFNEKGLITSEHTEYYSGYKYIVSYTYDEEDRLILESYDDNGEKWYSCYTYDENGYLACDTTAHSGHRTVITYTNSTDGLLLARSNRYYLDGEEEPISGFDESFEYDAAGNRVLERSVDIDGSASECRYEFNDAGLITKDSYSDSDGAWHCIDYTYDAEGRLISEKKESSDEYWYSRHISYDSFSNEILNHFEAFGDEVDTIESSYCSLGCCLLSQTRTNNSGVSTQINSIDKFHNIIRSELREEGYDSFRSELREFVCLPK